MLLERFAKFDMIPGLNGGFALVQKDTPLWSGRVLFFTKQEDGSFQYSCGIEEQGVPAVCHGTTQILHQMLWMHHGLTYQEHSEARGEKQGAD